MSKNKFILGKGLGALIPGADSSASEAEREITRSADLGGTLQATAFVSLSLIAPNPFQPRKDFTPESLGELVESIREHGIIQPVTLRSISGGKYELVSGERRVRASRIAGLEEIPAFVIEVPSDRKMLELAIVENVQREDLNPIEEAESYLRLIQECGLRQDEVAERISKDRTTVSNFLRLLKLPEEIQESLRKGELGMGHAKAIMAIPDSVHQIAVWRSAIADGSSVRKLEELARKAVSESRVTNGDSPRKKSGRPMKHLEQGDEQIAEMIPLENSLKQKLGTQVRIRQRTGEQGEIVIEFYSGDDLERISEMLMNIREE
ncbi:MAG: ParB/RepB/Spo0J family partition protein [Bacteroidota bacterium]|nr:ParB/RepB/Spo0J family partition protein [Bacteroidota bacterium]MDP4235238.1 ParB/RepB/Spo0J family partition protein [Bacteroidota bacterium]